MLAGRCSAWGGTHAGMGALCLLACLRWERVPLLQCCGARPPRTANCKLQTHPCCQAVSLQCAVKKQRQTSASGVWKPARASPRSPSPCPLMHKMHKTCARRAATPTPAGTLQTCTRRSSCPTRTAGTARSCASPSRATGPPTAPRSSSGCSSSRGGAAPLGCAPSSGRSSSSNSSRGGRTPGPCTQQWAQQQQQQQQGGPHPWALPPCATQAPHAHALPPGCLRTARCLQTLAAPHPPAAWQTPGGNAHIDT